LILSLKTEESRNRIMQKNLQLSSERTL